MGILFPCSHARMTFPMTMRRRGIPVGPPHVVCLDCGREFEYDWQEMRVAGERRVPVGPAVTEEG
jgi:hypothetical protein